MLGRSNSSQSHSTSPIPYSKIHERSSKTRESLLLNSKPSVQSSTAQSHVDNPSNQQKIIIDTTHIGVSQSAGSLFFDVSSRAETLQEIYMAAFRQFNDFVGQRIHRSGNNRFLEVNFDIDENRAAALKAGLTFNDGSVIITPSVAMKSGSMIKRVNLDRLPWLRTSDLLDGLKATFQNYGEIRDVGVVKDADSGTFLGAGYVILDCSPELNTDNDDPFLQLSHIIEWVNPDGSKNGNIFIHAYWKDMPTYCKYCHESGHSASECNKSPSGKRVCFACLKSGHIRANCPEKIKSSKERRRHPVPSDARLSSVVESSAVVLSPPLKDLANPPTIHSCESIESPSQVSDVEVDVVNPNSSQSTEAEACSDTYNFPTRPVNALSTDNDVAQAHSEILTLETTRSDSPTDSLPPQEESMECDNDEIAKTTLPVINQSARSSNASKYAPRPKRNAKPPLRYEDDSRYH
ncbi:hypothetical protein BCV72DRAFT_326130 [Rhizopus microsporus var. microsporus]|uniref:CCHC-type domain-containing protein n=1 Tax=Rhizopus microsporus var. microsporus TaxID=86635 RepID=A0A1X0RH59_RHIZD|nr:hypothetical protein BCV72DRAFT_326130 [Rhizopus microsporus var. microsporus]